MALLSALDLLLMPDAEQQVLRCLSRQPHLTVSEIANATDIPLEELEEVLGRMADEGRLVEQLKDNERVFSVRFGRAETNVRNMPVGLMAVFDQPPDTFLAEVPLTAHLSPREREILLSKSTSRTLLPDEICIWQGKKHEYVGLVRKGLLKKVRLQGRQQARRTTGYFHRTEWFGLIGVLSETTSVETCMAVTESELILWPAKDFLNFMANSLQFSLDIGRLLSQELHKCRSLQQLGAGKVCVIESVDEAAGGTSLAANLAMLAAQGELDNAPGGRRVVVWTLEGDSRAARQSLGLIASTAMLMLPGKEKLVKHPGGFDVLLQTEQNNYPPQVQLDIWLTNLQAQYDYVICDAAVKSDEISLRLRGQADTLITITQNPADARRATSLWERLQPYSRPGQRRFLVLNRAPSQTAPCDPAFHFVLPNDKAGMDEANEVGLPIVEAAPDSPLSLAYREVYRRLSLNHSIGIFIPSTIDVDQAIDNTEQVQSALSFLGNVFGGATRSEVEGCWRSEESGLVVEQVTIVRTFITKRALERHLDEVIVFATQLKQEMKQEAVALDVDNQLILV
jgi:CRP-like cAMP-binding protein